LGLLKRSLCRREYAHFRQQMRFLCQPELQRDFEVGAVKLVDDLAGESPASASFPVGAVVISGDGAGDQTVGSPEVNVLVGWM